MSTDPAAQDGAVPPGAASDSDGDSASDSDGNAAASPSASPEQIFEEATARFAAINEEWQKARDALLSG